MKYALRVYNANERFYGMYINISIFTAINLHLALEKTKHRLKLSEAKVKIAHVCA